MGIKGAEGMTDRDIALVVQQGGRVVVFRYCISLLIITFRQSATVLVRPGQSVAMAGLPYTLLSLCLGWWGFPFGLIFTPITIFHNLGGGTDVTGQFRLALDGRGPALPTPGTSVVVPWSDGQTYTGTVLDARGDQVYVRFPNGQEQWMPATGVRRT
jgi:hypothetical protein